MKYKKFRELNVDVFKINFKNFKIKEILNYMPAGNDVIEVLTTNNKNYFVKIERSKVADFLTEFENINLLKDKYNKVPKIIEFINEDNLKCLVEEKINGKRLSEIINEKNKENYIYKLGKELAIIHKLKYNVKKTAKQRIINELPKEENYEFDMDIKPYIKYLEENDYKKEFNTFIHGDFHYGNILWESGEISGVLDWEYSGIGQKEQDIAWALIYRPGQKFMKSIKDIRIFLNGYLEENNYDIDKLKWCLINGLCHFYLMNKDLKYKSEVLKILEELE